MPEAPHTSILTRYVLENPWPLAIGLLVAAAVVGWIGLREGIPKRLKIAAILGSLGTIVLIAGLMIETAGERARQVVNQFVQAVVEKDLIAAGGFIAPSAVLSVGSPTNPGLDADAINEGLSNFAARYTIESNDITMLRGFTEDAQTATVHLGCYTVVDFPTTSKWVLRVMKQEDGEWRITRITCISINEQSPSLEWMR